MSYKDRAARNVQQARYREQNREKLREYHRAWYAKHRGRLNAKFAAWRRENPGAKSGQHRADRYRLSRTDYMRMLDDQGGKCAICKGEPCGRGPMSVLQVDHDHTTGEVRALLCQACNKGLGYFRDTPTLLAKAAFYVQLYSAGRRESA